MSLQMYYDNTTITDHSLFGDHQNILDLDFQHGFHVGDSQQFVWGLGYRSIRDKNDSSFTVSLQPNQVTLNQFSTFLQDEISLVDNRLQITLGSKFERNEFTGFEIEPNARLLEPHSKSIDLDRSITRRPDTGLDRGGTAAKFCGYTPRDAFKPDAVAGRGGGIRQPSIQFRRPSRLRTRLSSAGYQESLARHSNFLQQLFKSSHCGAGCAFCGREPSSDRHRHPLCRRKQDERWNLRRRTVRRLESRSEVEAGGFLQLSADGHSQEQG